MYVTTHAYTKCLSRSLSQPLRTIGRPLVPCGSRFESFDKIGTFTEALSILLRGKDKEEGVGSGGRPVARRTAGMFYKILHFARAMNSRRLALKGAATPRRRNTTVRLSGFALTV